METKFFVQENGQEVRTVDIDSFSKNAALADDRVLWELYRLAPYDVAGPQKAVWTYGVEGWPKPESDNSTALVHPDPAGGKVRVRAFRAGLSSQTSSGNLERVRDIRTGYSVPGTTLGYTQVSITVNAALNPRWTVVWAKVEPDADGDQTTVKKRDPLTGVVTDATVVLNTKTTVTLGTTDGTAAAFPTRPNLPADAAGAWYIALAYIRVPASFTSGTVLDRQAIHECAPCLTLNSATGALTSRPANQQHVVEGTVDVSGTGALQVFRPRAYLPSTMVGGEVRYVLIQNHIAPVSHADGAVVDDSCDWRFRYFDWIAMARNGNTATASFASDRQATGTDIVGSAWLSIAGYIASGFGQSFVDDTQKGGVFTVADGNGAAAVVQGSELAELSGGSQIMLYVRNTDGALCVRFAGTPQVQILIKLTASGPYSNFGLLS